MVRVLSWSEGVADRLTHWPGFVSGLFRVAVALLFLADPAAAGLTHCGCGEEEGGCLLGDGSAGQREPGEDQISAQGRKERRAGCCCCRSRCCACDAPLLPGSGAVARPGQLQQASFEPVEEASSPAWRPWQ
ncbi:hypothetical protein NDU88_007340 [Pleurodeles waltl]|uniref:Uncharacterized protein n=1 Tax=Pleurodeles waltl TaxID=8319 RepID=A0AAV7U0Y8_PLEWA|nr:hypothetical protein NDU88_007340 [Pleurodeles waltl]